MKTLETPNVVISGMGAVTPIGNLSIDDGSYWQALLGGRTNFKPFQFGDPVPHKITAKVASEIDGFDFSPYAARIPAINQRKFRPTRENMDRATQLGLAAGLEALTMAGLAPGDPTIRRDNIGMIVGSGLGGGRSFEGGVRSFDALGRTKRIAFTVLNVMLNGLPGMGTISFGLGGPSYSVAAACASSSFAIIDAYTIVASGEADAMLVIGTEAVTTAFQLGCFNQLEALSESEGSHTSKPFGLKRDGFVMGEGAGAIVITREDFARSHNMPVIARLLGYARNSDAWHTVQPSVDGITECIQKAIEHAGLYPHDIGCVNAHATATPTGDDKEALAIWRMFADPSLPYVTPLQSPYITATKANLGHTLGAASILGTIATIRSMTEGLLPPIRGFRIDPKCRRPWLEAGITAKKDNPLAIVTRKTRANIPVAICSAFGFGGHNAVTVVARPDFQP